MSWCSSDNPRGDIRCLCACADVVASSGKFFQLDFAGKLAAMKAAAINGSVYTHPIGDQGHGAGPIIGLWDRQQGVPGRGDVLVLPDTWFSIELSATTAVPEWGGQDLWVGQEEDAALSGDKIDWVLRRQTKYLLIR